MSAGILYACRHREAGVRMPNLDICHCHASRAGRQPACRRCLSSGEPRLLFTAQALAGGSSMRSEKHTDPPCEKVRRGLYSPACNKLQTTKRISVNAIEYRSTGQQSLYLLIISTNYRGRPAQHLTIRGYSTCHEKGIAHTGTNKKNSIPQSYLARASSHLCRACVL